MLGVMPADFVFLDPAVRFWIPETFGAEERAEDSRFSQNHDGIARLAANVTVAQAQAQVDGLNAGVIERSGALKTVIVNAGYRTVISRMDADLVRNVRAALRLLWGGALFVLLIAAINVSNLALVRTSGRLKEIATRYAIGAARARRCASGAHRDDSADDNRRGAWTRAGRVESRCGVVDRSRRLAARSRDPPRRHRDRLHHRPGDRAGPRDRPRARDPARRHQHERGPARRRTYRDVIARRRGSRAARSSLHRSRSRSCCSSAPDCCWRASIACSPSIPASAPRRCSPAA